MESHNYKIEKKTRLERKRRFYSCCTYLTILFNCSNKEYLMCLSCMRIGIEDRVLLETHHHTEDLYYEVIVLY